MKKQKVRPMVDKDLRDEVVGYLGGAGSFNEALRWYIKGYKRLTTKNKAQAEERNSVAGMNNQLMFTKLQLQETNSHAVSLMMENQALKNQLKRDAQELNELKKVNAELSTTLDGTDKAYKSLFELYMEKKDRGFIYFCLGNAIGAAVMTFVFNVM